MPVLPPPGAGFTMWATSRGSPVWVVNIATHSQFGCVKRHIDPSDTREAALTAAARD